MEAFVPQAGATPDAQARSVHFWAEDKKSLRRRKLCCAAEFRIALHRRSAFGIPKMAGEDHCRKQGTESPEGRLQLQTGVFAMRRSRPQPIRNKLDLADRTQVRLVRKRLGLSDAELTNIVERIGNSIAAISKEAALQRATTLPKPDDVPPAAVITSATVGDQARRK
jgi:hypothetical protein